jgi:hypothetical protein
MKRIKEAVAIENRPRFLLRVLMITRLQSAMLNKLFSGTITREAVEATGYEWVLAELPPRGTAGGLSKLPWRFSRGLPLSSKRGSSCAGVYSDAPAGRSAAATETADFISENGGGEPRVESNPQIQRPDVLSPAGTKFEDIRFL